MQIIRDYFAPKLLTTVIRFNDSLSCHAISCRTNAVAAGSKDIQSKDALYITVNHTT